MGGQEVSTGESGLRGHVREVTASSGGGAITEPGYHMSCWIISAVPRNTTLCVSSVIIFIL